MSMMRCDACDRLIDTDYDTECWQEDDTALCGSCRETYSCAECGDSVGTAAERKAETAYCGPCNSLITKGERLDEMLDDPRRGQAEGINRDNRNRR